MNGLKGEEILGRAAKLRESIIRARRELHGRPELCHQEDHTAAFVADYLSDLGLEVTEGVAGTGVLGLLRGKGQGRTVALRADMDALPIDEANDVPYKSRHEGRMHACGHDGHMAMVLGAAALLAELESSLRGNVKFLFQPAEECPPEGGAKGMIADGALEDPPVAAVFGLHIWPDLPAGKVGLKSGPIMAAADSFEISVRGEGGHGAAPHQATDALVVAAHAVLALQTVVSRNVDPLESTVLSIGTCHGGKAFNVIAEQVMLEGTVRYLNPRLGGAVREDMKRIVENVGRAHGASCELDYQFGFPPTINDLEKTQLVAQAAGEVLGEEQVDWIQAPSMTGEDFAYYLQQVPGCYFWLGTKNPSKGIVHPLHSPRFRIDEDVLNLGTAVLAKAALDSLSAGGRSPQTRDREMDY